MPEAIIAIQDDIQAYTSQGHHWFFYGPDHALAALIAADIDPASLPFSPAEIRDLAIIDTCKRALDQ